MVTRSPLLGRTRRSFPARTRFFYIITGRPATGTATEGPDVSALQELGVIALAWVILAVPAGLLCLLLWRPLPAGARQLFPWPRRRSVPWLGADVWFAFGVMILVPGLVLAALENSGFFTLLYGNNTASLSERKALWALVAAAPLQAALILAELALVRGARPADVGLTGRRLAQNVVAGYLLWLVLAAVALLLYWAMTLFMETQKHPMEQLSRLPLLGAEWTAIVFLTVVAAPLLEELVFRGVLLPWQTSRGLDAQLTVGAAALAVAVFYGITRQGTFNPVPMAFVLALLPGYVVLPYLHRRWRERRRGPTAEDRAGGGPERNGVASDHAAPWWEHVSRGLAGFVRLASDRRVNVLLAFYSNGLLFAAAHSSVWPSPIPLFLLGVGLAWLAHRTQSLVGPMVAHALFNGVACLEMFLPG
jgi:membrane protease YdiL (CAAX protease family)